MIWSGTMKEKLRRIFTSKHPRYSNFNIIIILTIFVILLTMIFSWRILHDTPLFDSFSENTLIAIYAIMMALILVVGFTFASLINFKDNAEYYSVKGRKRAFLIESVIVAIIITVSYNVAGPVLVRFFDFLNQAYYYP